jgi:Mrp family chromosome partitioning ATPase
MDLTNFANVDVASAAKGSNRGSLRHDTLTHHSATLRDYLRIVRRRKWVILQAVVLVPLAAGAFSARQKPVYESSSQVLINPQNLGYALNGIPDAGASQADRIVETASQLARVPALAQRVIVSADVHGLTPDEFLANSSATPKTNTYIEQLSVRNRYPGVARRLASAYAQEFALYKQSLDTLSLQRALNGVQADLRTATDPTSPEYQSARQNQQTLTTMMALQAANTTAIRLAGPAVKIQPKPVRNVILGLLLGTVLGFGLAFLWEALDTRVRSAEEIADRLDLPMLARLPKPPRKLRKANKLVMLEDPRGVQAEAFRGLRTNLDFMRLNREAKTIMVTSSVEQEGKSTTVGNLAVALARGGQKVAVVDADLRRPFLDRFFDLQSRPGLTQVALGHVELAEALSPIAIPDPPSKRAGAEGDENHIAAVDLKREVNPKVDSSRDWDNPLIQGAGVRRRRPLQLRRRPQHARPGADRGNGKRNGPALSSGLVMVLIAGPIPPNPGEFVGGPALDEILGYLRERFDVVLIDAPPALQVNDALALSSKVDALIVITRMNVVRRHMLSELRRMLDRAPAEKLGFIVTGAKDEEGYGDADYYYGSYTRAPEKEPAA